MTGWWRIRPACRRVTGAAGGERQTSDVVDRARRWIGTPYVHQARRRGVGCDCLGLVLGVWEERFGTLPETPPDYTPDWSEAGSARSVVARRGSGTWSKNPLAGPEPGDVLLFRMRRGRSPSIWVSSPRSAPMRGSSTPIPAVASSKAG
jgi:NlpC/P60 family putative phage cell wall peptidase